MKEACAKEFAIMLIPNLASLSVEPILITNPSSLGLIPSIPSIEQSIVSQSTQPILVEKFTSEGVSE